MSVFGNIMSSIFGVAAAKPVAAQPPSPMAHKRRRHRQALLRRHRRGRWISPLSWISLPAPRVRSLDWRKSIVDLLKLLNLDSSLAARKQLAEELHYPGSMKGSAAMNVWLHKQVMLKLAENGGKVPADLKH